MSPAVHTYETIVPYIYDSVRDLVHEWCKDVTAEVGNFDDCYGHRVEEIENEARDGFIPFTQGGFDGLVYASIQYAYGSGFIPKAIQPYLDRSIKDCNEAWDADNPEHLVADLLAPSPEERGQLALFEPSQEHDHWRNKYYEHEHEYLSEGGTYFDKVRTIFYDIGARSNETGVPEVCFCVGLNTDFEYGRDSIPWLSYYGGDPECTKWAWEKTVPVSRITEELMAEFREKAVNALRDL